MKNVSDINSADIKPVEGRFVWKGPDVDYENDATHYFSEGEIRDIDKALICLGCLDELVS